MGVVVTATDTDAQKRDWERSEHAEADTGERVPADVHGAQANGKGPQQRGGLEYAEHELT